MNAPIETTLVQRLQALASELEGQMRAAEAAGASPPEELESAKRMRIDLQEAAAVLTILDELLALLEKTPYLSDNVKDQVAAIQERLQYADPEP